MSSRDISSSRGDRQNPKLGARKTQNFKVLCFEPNFRGRFIVTIKGTHDLILPRNLSQTDLFMFEVRFIHFLKFWAEQIQALPNSVRWLPNSGILFPTSPNMYGKPIKRIQNSRKNFYSLILHLPVDSSPWVTRKNNEFHK